MQELENNEARPKFTGSYKKRVFRVAVLLFIKPKLERGEISPRSSFGLIKSSTATRNIAIKPAEK